ncbi:MAG: Insertion element protein [Actinomycetota bacterium]|nr:Insertion element protein [Actinomycetota bacterium]
MSAGGHSQPFYCPYCGEEDFEPAGAEAGTFTCNSCDRAWKVQLLGVNVSAGREPS